MMNKFDEYIQGRIYEAYEKVYSRANTFKEVIDEWAPFLDNEEQWRGWLRTDLRIGKQRAKDYAHYIMAYLEEQQEPKLLDNVEADEKFKLANMLRNLYHAFRQTTNGFDTAISLLEQESLVDTSPVAKSHLTDEDSKHIKNLAAEMISAYSVQHQDNTATKLINFINSLKGE